MIVNMESVPCPECGAAIGQPCMSSRTHYRRMAEAKRHPFANVDPTSELDFMRSLTPTELSAYIDFRQQQKRWHCGLLFRPGSLWIGIHWSKKNKRWCINLIPCVTFWVTKPGGKTP